MTQPRQGPILDRRSTSGKFKSKYSMDQLRSGLSHLNKHESKTQARAGREEGSGMGAVGSSPAQRRCGNRTLSYVVALFPVTPRAGFDAGNQPQIASLFHPLIKQAAFAS